MEDDDYEAERLRNIESNRLLLLSLGLQLPGSEASTPTRTRRDEVVDEAKAEERRIRRERAKLQRAGMFFDGPKRRSQGTTPIEGLGSTSSEALEGLITTPTHHVFQVQQPYIPEYTPKYPLPEYTGPLAENLWHPKDSKVRRRVKETKAREAIARQLRLDALNALEKEFKAENGEDAEPPSIPIIRATVEPDAAIVSEPAAAPTMTLDGAAPSLPPVDTPAPLPATSALDSEALNSDSAPTAAAPIALEQPVPSVSVIADANPVVTEAATLAEPSADAPADGLEAAPVVPTPPAIPEKWSKELAEERDYWVDEIRFFERESREGRGTSGLNKRRKLTAAKKSTSVNNSFDVGSSSPAGFVATPSNDDVGRGGGETVTAGPWIPKKRVHEDEEELDFEEEEEEETFQRGGGDVKMESEETHLASTTVPAATVAAGLQTDVISLVVKDEIVTPSTTITKTTATVPVPVTAGEAPEPIASAVVEEMQGTVLGPSASEDLAAPLDPESGTTTTRSAIMEEALIPPPAAA